MTNGQQQKYLTPKPMKPDGQKHDVSLRRIPKVGEMFFSIGKDGGVNFYTVVNLGRYQQFGSGAKSTLVYWRSEKDGKLFVSAVRKAKLFPLMWPECADQYADEDMHRELAQHIGVTKKPKAKINKTYQVGDMAKLTVLHKNIRSQRVLAKYVTMTLVYRHPKMDADYWQDEQGNPYWGRKGSKDVRPFPVWIDIQQWIRQHGNQINCSGN